MAWIVQDGERLTHMDQIAWIGKLFSHTEYPPPPAGLEAEDIPTEAAVDDNSEFVGEQAEAPGGREVYKVVAVYNNPWSWGSGLPQNIAGDGSPPNPEPPIEEQEPAPNEKLENKLMRRLIEVLKSEKIHFHVNNLLEPATLFVGNEAACEQKVKNILSHLKQGVEYITLDD